MPLNRRCFLKTISLGCLSIQPLFSTGCTHKKFLNPDEDILISGGKLADEASIQNVLVIINLRQQEKRVIETPFLPHGTIIDPNNKYRILCFEKNGRAACEVDLQAGKVTKTFQTESNHFFSGHACFSNDGNRLYSIESDGDEIQGSIVVRDGKTLQTIKILPSLGLQPHDCQLTADNILLVSNTGQSESNFHQPSVVAIDVTTEKLVERIQLDEKNLNCGHFKITGKNNLVISSAPLATEKENTPGGVSIRNQSNKVITMTEPELVIKRMTGEALSIAINQQNSIAAITHPEANLITFWSIENSRIVKAFGLENPRGISQTLDNKYFVVSYGNRAAMAKVSVSDLTPVENSIVQPTLASGEHVINWSKTLRRIMPGKVYD